jgi:hypothetical protein
MSQNDFTIDNQTFPATRSDINSALQALASLSSGASAPSTTFAYQLWVDTTADPNILNIRNSANNAWIKIGEVNQGSAAFILTAYAILQAGSAAAPSHSFDVDRDTGMYRAAANIIGFATNGTERFRVGDSGQLGIGGATYGTSGQVLTSGGASAAPSWATPASSGQLIRAPQVLTGTSYTTPAGCTLIIVEMWAGGGGGGSGASGGGNATNCAGGGGGGGGFLKQAITVSPSTSYTIAVGAGGAGGAGLGASAGRVGNNGTAGGTTSIIVSGTTYSASGGGAGNRGAYSAGGSSTTNAAPAAGGATSGVNPILAMTGGASQSPDTLNTAGGADGGTGWNGGAAFGGFMSQGGGNYTQTPATVVAFGGGGGGSIGNSGSNAVLAGATGGSGRFIVTEFT